MAIPSFFNTQSGYALMRQNPTSLEWFFVEWMQGFTDFALDFPAPGGWNYAVWAICASGDVPLTVAYGQTGFPNQIQLVVQELKR